MIKITLALLSLPVAAMLLSDRTNPADPCQPSGPFLMRGARIYEMGIAFDPLTVLAVLPDGLWAAQGATGGIAVFCVQDGWRPRPYTAAYLWIDIDDHPSQSGSPGRYIAAGRFSPDILRSIPAGADLSSGEPTVETISDRIVALVSLSDDAEDSSFGFELALSTDHCEEREYTVTRYLYRGTDEGRLISVEVPGAFEWCEAQPLAASVQLHDRAHAHLEPRQLLWAGAIHNADLIWGSPDP